MLLNFFKRVKHFYWIFSLKVFLISLKILLINIILDQTYENNVKIYDTDNEISILLYLTEFKRDFDKMYVVNNYSSVYHYRLKAFVDENPNVFTIMDVYFNLIDVNDNLPFLINYNTTSSNSYVYGTLNENFEADTLVNINEDYFILKLNDADFSKEFGVKSVYCYTNDTRFYIDNEFINNELNKIGSNINVLNNGISLLIRSKNGHEKLQRNRLSKTDLLYLNVTCKDSYFQNSKGFDFKSTSILFRIQIIADPTLSSEELKIRRKPIFEKDTYTFNVNESWTGYIGKYMKFIYTFNLYFLMLIDHGKYVRSFVCILRP
jgi:hypothetical protein